jgi:hypothetical protein
MWGVSEARVSRLASADAADSTFLTCLRTDRASRDAAVVVLTTGSRWQSLHGTGIRVHPTKPVETERMPKFLGGVAPTGRNEVCVGT